MKESINSQDAYQAIRAFDDELSNRFISLDPSGYFLIKINQAASELVVEHYENDIDNEGRAVDKKTGKPLECDDKKTRVPLKTYRGSTAKEIGIKLTEGDGSHPISRLDHALYLGRELQKAETCLVSNQTYIQD